MRSDAAHRPDWRDAAGYGALLGADRSLFAWEWLRRDPAYREAAATRGGDTSSGAAAFGLVRLEPPAVAVPFARPIWRSDVHPYVLDTHQHGQPNADDAFDPDRLRDFSTVASCAEREHLLLSDGLSTVRLDGPAGIFRGGPIRLGYRISGLRHAEPPLLTLRRFLALCRTGGFRRLLHPPEIRARRWILLLRASDALDSGAGQREIAEHLISRSVQEPRWRTREASVRLQVQRLVRSARAFAEGGYRSLLQ